MRNRARTNTEYVRPRDPPLRIFLQCLLWQFVLHHWLRFDFHRGTGNRLPNLIRHSTGQAFTLLSEYRRRKHGHDADEYTWR